MRFADVLRAGNTKCHCQQSFCQHHKTLHFMMWYAKWFQKLSASEALNPVNILPYMVRGTLPLWVNERCWGGSNVIIKVLRRERQEDQSQEKKKKTDVKIKPVVGMVYFGDGGCDHHLKNVSKLRKLDKTGKWISLLKLPEET